MAVIRAYCGFHGSEMLVVRAYHRLCRTEMASVRAYHGLRRMEMGGVRAYLGLNLFHKYQMDRKYQVFISSTYEDLKEQRDAVVKAVLKMGHLPVGMEMFNAAEQQQWEIIKRHIDNSDYYVLIVANRYGSIGPKNISYTEQEYEYAIEKGVPCLGFLLQKGTAWPDTMVETGPAKKKLDAFKKKVGSRPVNFWDNTDKLALQVYASLSEAITLTARPGWIRATEAASPQVAEELARLSKENGELKLQLSQVQTEDEISRLARIIRETAYSYDDNGKEAQVEFQQVFEMLFENRGSIWEGKIIDSFEESAEKKIKDVVSELQLLGLVKKGMLSDGSVKGKNRWLYDLQLTEKGSQVYAALKY
jgi:hypothetical protein